MVGSAVIFDIEHSSFSDGPGLRTTVFFKGCHLKCAWCHNPEGQKSEPETMFFREKCIGCGSCRAVCPNDMTACTVCGKCEAVCPQGARRVSGTAYSVDALFAELEKDRVFYEASGGGVTLSGGECMLQIDFLESLLKKCRSHGIRTAVDTAGDVPWPSFERLLPFADLFLYDIKAVSEPLHRRFTGVSNVRILENLRLLSDRFSGDVIIRIPVIGGFNASEAEMKKIAGFVKTTRFQKVELLPYHEMGRDKYAALSLPFTAFETPSESEMESYRAIFL